MLHLCQLLELQNRKDLATSFAASSVSARSSLSAPLKRTHLAMFKRMKLSVASRKMISLVSTHTCIWGSASSAIKLTYAPVRRTLSATISWTMQLFKSLIAAGQFSKMISTWLLWFWDLASGPASRHSPALMLPSTGLCTSETESNSLISHSWSEQSNQCEVSSKEDACSDKKNCPVVL